jgi:hypothetical protein
MTTMNELLSPEEEERFKEERVRYGWINGLLHAHVQRLDATIGEEPPEPYRATWHLHRNGHILGLRKEIEAAYVAKYGPVPEEVDRHLSFMLPQYWMNPYRGDTVWRRSDPTYESPVM